MPIRFRCVYCDKLLGIARRKAGAVVNCPQCSQPLIVPTPEPEPQAQPAAAGVSAGPQTPGRLFEQDDFDVLLEADATVQASDPPQRRSALKPPPPPGPLPARPFPVEQSLPLPASTRSSAPAPLPLPAPRPATGFVLSGGKLILMAFAVGFLLLVAFGVGILVGRLTLATPTG